MSDKSKLQDLVKEVYDSIKYDIIHGYEINELTFSSLSEYYKLYILKRHICSVLSTKYKFKNKEFLYNTFKKHPNILVELLECALIINCFESFYHIFENKKDIVLKKDIYNKLLDISYKYVHHDDANNNSRAMSGNNSMYKYTRIIMKYEAEDMLFNNEDDEEIIEKEKELEKKDHEILLLQKDKEIERLKLEIEEIKKFYINS